MCNLSKLALWLLHEKLTSLVEQSRSLINSHLCSRNLEDVEIALRGVVEHLTLLKLKSQLKLCRDEMSVALKCIFLPWTALVTAVFMIER